MDQEAGQTEVSVPIPKPQGKNRLEKCMWSYCMLFPTYWFFSNTLFPFCIFFVFISKSCSFFFRKVWQLQEIQACISTKDNCIKAGKITSCFRKCAALTLFQRCLLLRSWYYQPQHHSIALEVQGLTARKLCD